MRSESSSTEMPLSSSIQSSVVTLVAIYSPSSLFSSESSEVSSDGCSSSAGASSPMSASPSPVSAASPWPASSPSGACSSELSSGDSVGSGSRSALLGGRGLAADEALLGDLAELQRQALDHRAETADQPGERAGDDAGELGVELLAAGQAGDRLEGVGVEGLAVHQAALVVEQLPLGPEPEDRLRRQRRVALDEGECRRALQMLLERFGPGRVGGAQRQPVLDDAEAGVGLAQPRRAARPPGAR